MNNVSARQSTQQRQSVAKIREQADAATFFNVLTDESMLEKLESLLPQHRERVDTPTNTLSMFFYRRHSTLTALASTLSMNGMWLEMILDGVR